MTVSGSACEQGYPRCIGQRTVGSGADIGTALREAGDA
jgi:hypothetical protein